MPSQKEVLEANEAEVLPEVEKHLRIIIEKGRITKTQLDKIRSITR